MKTRLIILVLLVVAAAAVGEVRRRRATTIEKKEPAPYANRIWWKAKEAKNNGQKKVGVPAPLIEYAGGAGTISAEEAFASSTVVVAHLVSKESTYLQDDITTWNKFAIDETLSKGKDVPCRDCVPAFAPETLLPLLPAEFLIPKTGGTVNIDGVEVQQLLRGYPEYELNQKYVLLINVYSSGFPHTVGGPVGVFKVLPNDKLAPIGESDHKIRKDFKDLYGNSLAQIRKHLKIGK